LGRSADELINEAEARVFASSVQGSRGRQGFVEFRALIAQGVERSVQLHATRSDLAGLPSGEVDVVRLRCGLEQGVVILVAGGLLAPCVLAAGGHGLARSPRLLAVGAASMFAVLAAIYLPYLPCDTWTYLRFLLPAFPVLAATAGAAIARLVARRAVGGVIAIALLAATGIALCRAHDALGAWRLNARYLAAADYVNAQLPANAVLISFEQSGALRYYTRRTILRFDLLSPGSLDPAIATLTTLGRPAYLVLDEFEIEAFRRRFSDVSALGRLERPARAVVDPYHPVYVFDTN